MLEARILALQHAPQRAIVLLAYKKEINAFAIILLGHMVPVHPKIVIQNVKVTEDLVGVLWPTAYILPQIILVALLTSINEI
jgi:hypothetical protein